MDILHQFQDFVDNSSAGVLVQAVVVLLIGLIAIKILLRVTRKVLARTLIDSALYTFIVNTIKVISLAILIVTVLSLLGIPTSTFVTVIAAVGAAVALAVQDSLSNFAGGLLIMISKPFVRGDLIESGGIMGKVQEIDLLYSKLITYDNKIICMPNSVLANNTLINYFGQELRRIDLKVGVSYEADIDHVKTVIRQVIESSDLLLTEPAPMIGVSDFADSGIIYDAFAWCRSEQFFDAKFGFYENLKKAFDREGIEIPYPQVVVHRVGNDKTEERTQINQELCENINNRN